MKKCKKGTRRVGAVCRPKSKARGKKTKLGALVHDRGAIRRAARRATISPNAKLYDKKMPMEATFTRMEDGSGYMADVCFAVQRNSVDSIAGKRRAARRATTHCGYGLSKTSPTKAIAKALADLSTTLAERK